MPGILSFLFTVAALNTIAFARTDQKLLGPSFEYPTHVSSSKVIQEAVQNITYTLNAAIRTGKSHFSTFNGSTTSFSLTAVSQLDSTPIIDFHHTSGSLNVSAGSTSKVTSNTVYRIGSVSKLFTVYALLLHNGTSYWNHPVTDFIPELRQASQDVTNQSSIIDRVQWDQVTVGALASQLSGIGRDCTFFFFFCTSSIKLQTKVIRMADNSGDMAAQNYPWTELGLPPLPPQQIPSCGINDNQLPCSRKGEHTLE